MKICIKDKLNHIPRLNDALDNWNHEMKIGDQLDCEAFTSHQEFDAIKKNFPPGLKNISVFFVYVWHEMLPKIKMTRRFYFFFAFAFWLSVVLS